MATSTAQSSPGVLPAANVRSSADPFPSDEFTTIINIPVFAEHVAARKDGSSIKFGLDELQSICNRCNRRIEETGDFAAITLGHTPSPDNATGWEPEVIGFAGPYRIGRMPGTRKYAILADFHVFKGRENELRKRPRRSPELWMSDTPEDMFLDPIALLGALPPRLDMGMLYAKVQEGREVWKYAASGPSPSSVFVPDGTSEKVKYAEWEENKHPRDEGGQFDEGGRKESALEAKSKQPVAAGKIPTVSYVSHGQAEGGWGLSLSHQGKQWKSPPLKGLTLKQDTGAGSGLYEIELKTGQKLNAVIPHKHAEHIGAQIAKTAKPPEKGTAKPEAQPTQSSSRQHVGIQRMKSGKWIISGRGVLMSSGERGGNWLGTAQSEEEANKLADDWEQKGTHLAELHAQKRYQKQEGEDSMLDPDEIQQILDALEQLDWVQQAKSMAAGEVGNNATPEGGPPGAPPGPMAPPQGAMPPGPGAPPEAAAGPPPGLAGTPAPPIPKEQGELPAEEEPDKEKSAMAEPETCPTCGQEVKKANYQAEGDAQGAGLKNTAEGAVEEPGKPKEGTAQQGKYARQGQKVRYAMEQQQYGAVGHKLMDLEAQVEKLKGQVGTERCKRVEAERYAALNDRRQHFVMDVDKEVERCKYAKMTDEQFAAHIEVIDNNYRRIPIGEQLPLHGRGIDRAADLAERPGLERTDYSKAASDEALDKCLAMAARGEKVDYGQVLTQVKSKNHQPLKT